MQHKASGAEPIYGFRPVLNAESIHQWAAESGFKSTLDPDDMHVTVIFSRDAFSPYLTGVANSADNVAAYGQIVVRGGKRSVEPLGDEGAVVLKIECAELVREHLAYREMGASWDFPQYMPHITITYTGMPSGGVTPYAGDIILGPMRVKPINDDWASDVVEVPTQKSNMAAMHRKFTDFAFELKAAPDQDGTFEGYASVFEVVDNGMDVVTRGAFAKSLASGRKVKMLWQHDTGHIIGVWEEIKEDERGLYVKGRLLADVEKGREALSLMRAGALDSMSIGYRTVNATKEGNGSVRRLLEVDLFEISLVTFPMLEAATVTDVKSIGTEREFERFLRDAGYSRKEATAIALHGFKGLNTLRDADGVGFERDNGDDAEVLSLLTQLVEKING